MMKEEDWSVDFIRAQCERYIENLPLNDQFIYKRSNSAKGIKAGDLKREKIEAEREKMSKLIAAAELFPQYQRAMRRWTGMISVKIYDIDAFTEIIPVHLPHGPLILRK